MAYLSWLQDGVLQRWALEKDCVLGRNHDDSDLFFPDQPKVSRRHASLSLQRDTWWIKDLDSRNGTRLKGESLPVEGAALTDGDDIRMGDLVLRFTLGFPGLDPDLFVERVGDLLTEVKPEPAQALRLVRGLELLHRSTEALLMESSSSSMIESLLSEAMKLLSAERGFVVMIGSDGSWRTAKRVGEVGTYGGLSQSVLRYVSTQRTGVLSNAPMQDPRFGGVSLAEMHTGALLCAPMEIEGQVMGMLYLDRVEEGRPFSRLDLALVQAFVRHGALALRHANLAQQALGQAEVQSETLRLRYLNESLVAQTGEILTAMGSSLRWLQSYGDKLAGEQSAVLRHEIMHLHQLVEAASHEVLLEPKEETSTQLSLEELQASLEPAWRNLLGLRGAELFMEPAPTGQCWAAGSVTRQAVVGLVEPLLLTLSAGQQLVGRWLDQGGNRALQFAFPPETHRPSADAWTLRSLHRAGIVWRWNEQLLTLTFPRGGQSGMDIQAVPMLGLVSEDSRLMGLFHTVAEAAELVIFPMEEEPPLPPLPMFRYLVLDAKSLQDPVACISAYRHHPNFTTVPILVVRAQEETFTTLLAAGATDWLPESFRWETLHHRLQVLKGQDALQRKALMAERLDSFRQMAGTLKHEINNPLAVISLQVEMLERKYPDEPKLGKIAEMVERIQGLMEVLQKMREAPLESYADGSSIVKVS
ncbi:MAG: FHA domain-containing protein [Firmicutes bacterium]|nr:FHA domain-containing protein [Bacillota bacterium]